MPHTGGTFRTSPMAPKFFPVTRSTYGHPYFWANLFALVDLTCVPLFTSMGTMPSRRRSTNSTS